MPLLQMGFRPFFLLAALLAAILTPLWPLIWFGRVQWVPSLPGHIWHAHEMLVGFTGAVVAGFLLTAVRNWTGRQTLQGAGLGLLALAWVGGRILALAPVHAGWGAAADMLFFAGLLVGIGRPLIATRNKRNLPFLALLSVLALLDLGVHLEPALAPRLLRGLLDGMMVLVVVVAARIIPMFTKNALPHAEVVRRPRLDQLALIAVLATGAAEVLGLPAWVVAVSSGVACLAVALRGASWAPLSTLGTPLLWVLHLGHAWVAVGFGLRALSVLGVVIPSAATHALAVGAIGTLTLGMMSRVALGHTGRPLVAPSSAVVGYVFMSLAVVARVLAAVNIAPYGLLVASGALFGLAFLAFVVGYTPVLLRPRVDGRPG